MTEAKHVGTSSHSEAGMGHLTSGETLSAKAGTIAGQSKADWKGKSANDLRGNPNQVQTSYTLLYGCTPLRLHCPGFGPHTWSIGQYRERLFHVWTLGVCICTCVGLSKPAVSISVNGMNCALAFSSRGNPWGRLYDHKGHICTFTLRLFWRHVVIAVLCIHAVALWTQTMYQILRISICDLHLWNHIYLITVIFRTGANFCYNEKQV